MASKEKTDWKAERRKRAWALYQTGWQQKKIAEALGVSRGAVSQWAKRARTGGQEALDTPPRTGRPARLSRADRQRRVKMLAQGAEAFGFRGAVWTNPRVAQLIEGELGVRYHPAHVSRILKALGWTPQEPRVQAKQRKPKEIERWPELKRRPSKKTGRSSS